MSETQQQPQLEDLRRQPCEGCGKTDEDGLNWLIPDDSDEHSRRYAVLCSVCFLGPAKKEECDEVRS
jgi:hypothetical protein